LQEKNRSVGVTAIAILALVGSALLMGMAALVAFAMFALPTSVPNDPNIPPIFFKTIRFVVPLVYGLPAVWGIVTSIGLIRLRNWARISTIVFSVLLMVFGGFGMLMSVTFSLMPPPASGVDPKMLFYMGVGTAVFSLGQIGIGIWWLIFFTRKQVKAQFVPTITTYVVQMQHPGMSYPASMPPPMAANPAPNPSGRPLSITIIAWFLLAGCAFVPINLLLHSPAILFTTILTGWKATLCLLAFAGLNIYLGTALLRMKPAGRLMGIGYFTFAFLNSAIFFVAPGRSARLTRFLALQQSMFPWMPSSDANSPFHIDIMPFLMFGAVCGLILCCVPLYFLVTAKAAFDGSAL